MRILFLSHRLPYPPSHGSKIRCFNIISHLARHHEVTVASLARSEAEVEAGRPLSHSTKLIVETISPIAALARMIARVPTPVPSAIGYFHSPALARRLRDEIARSAFDVIFVHCAFVAHYVADVRGPRKILDFCDMDSHKWLAYARFRRWPVGAGYALEGRKMRRAEARLARYFDIGTGTTESELEILRSYNVPVESRCLPIDVDTEYFQTASERYDPDSLVFVGRMDYFPNEEGIVDFCRRTLPLIRARRPKTTLTIVGADPSAAVRKLAGVPGVTVTGIVPDVRPYLSRSAVAIAPLRIARGTQTKILEAMAMGVPTVASVASAGGVDAEPGRDLLVAGTPEEFAATVVRLLEDPAERRRLGDAGRRCMMANHSPAKAMRIVDEIIGVARPPTSSRA